LLFLSPILPRKLYNAGGLPCSQWAQLLKTCSLHQGVWTMKKIIFSLGIFTLLFSLQAFGWGKTGHRVVGQIATKHLNGKAKREIKKILGVESLAQGSTWPDFVKSDSDMRKKFSHWHYVNAKKGVKLKDRKVNPKGDILFGIRHFVKILNRSKSSPQEKLHALRYVVHFIGDIHQPLHTGFAEDRGANSVQLKWFGQDTNLHKVWDEDLIDMQQLSFTEYTAFVDHATPVQIQRWQNSKALDWANESRKLLANAYLATNGKYWEWNYNYIHIETINKRILMAGVRLAGVLNEIYK